MTAAGFLAMTVRKARAEDSGVRRPPSQCLTASRLKPKVSEKRACVILDTFSQDFSRKREPCLFDRDESEE